MTKNEIKDEGWSISEFSSNNLQRGDYIISFKNKDGLSTQEYNENIVEVMQISSFFIIMEDGLPVYHKSILYKGRCPNIEDFRYIMKLLKIN